MSDNQIWFGFLEAGDKSTAVALDKRIDTGNPDTLYLFNLTRKQILEYKRQIVEPKLREFKGKEQSKVLGELELAYAEARGNFTPRIIPAAPSAERVAPAPAKKPHKADADNTSGNTDADAGSADGDED